MQVRMSTKQFSAYRFCDDGIFRNSKLIKPRLSSSGKPYYMLTADDGTRCYYTPDSPASLPDGFTPLRQYPDYAISERSVIRYKKYRGGEHSVLKEQYRRGIVGFVLTDVFGKRRWVSLPDIKNMLDK